MVSELSNELKGWIPWKLSSAGCEWLYTGTKKFTEPFFDDTIAVCKNLDENRKRYKVVSDLQVIASWAGEINCLVPSLIIFHISRCGSTLLSQLLSLDQTNIVLSQVPLFDEILRLPYKKPPAELTIASQYLDAVIKFYAQKINGDENHLYIKTDSWHLHFYSQLRVLFPLVPFIFLYRNPLEVIHSHQKQRGSQSVPGMIEPEVFGFSKAQFNEPNLDVYMSNILLGYFTKIIGITEKDPLSLTFNYSEGMSSILKKIDAFTGLHVTEETGEGYNERIQFHSKHPNRLFSEEIKKFPTPGYMVPVVELYEQLDSITLARYSSL